MKTKTEFAIIGDYHAANPDELEDDVQKISYTISYDQDTDMLGNCPHIPHTNKEPSPIIH